ncbi:MAG: hypothetical protein U0176_00050 [Bacteroidia bacterium]
MAVRDPGALGRMASSNGREVGMGLSLEVTRATRTAQSAEGCDLGNDFTADRRQMLGPLNDEQPPTLREAAFQKCHVQRIQ